MPNAIGQLRFQDLEATEMQSATLNWPENDIHVSVDTLQRVHGAATARGDGEHRLLIPERSLVIHGRVRVSKLSDEHLQGIT